MRTKYWEERNWTVPDIDKRAIWLAVALGFDSGPRIGNITEKDGKNGPDHCIRAKHCLFLVADPTTSTERQIEGVWSTAGPRTSELLLADTVGKRWSKGR